MRIAEEVQVQVVINLDDDLNLAFLRLPVTTVANQVTRNLNVDISSEIKKLALLSQTKFPLGYLHPKDLPMID